MIAPTHYAPLWLAPDDAFRDSEGCLFCTTRGALVRSIIPADRVTIAPEPYMPKAGDRVATKLGYDATILATEPDAVGRIPIMFHLDLEGDRYTTLDPAEIDGAVQ